MNGLKMKYFVLKPAGNDAYAQASRAAMKAYAEAIKDENVQLNHDLHMWAINEQGEANKRDIDRKFAQQDNRNET